jgi:proline dehydrogenase
VSASRKLLLAIADNPALADRAARAAFVRRSVTRFMPGEHVEDAIAAALALRAGGIGTMLTKLGENLTRVEDAEDVTKHYLHVLDHVKDVGLNAEISVKPTQLGLDLDADLCASNLERLVDYAAAQGRFVWIDMESSGYVDRTLDLFRRARARSPLVGIALQAYLYRTASDIEGVLPLGPSIRLVKGAYLEPPSAAFPRKTDVDANYLRLSHRLLSQAARGSGARLQVATHDRALVDRISAVIAEERVADSAYEFAMLYGIQTPLQRKLADAGRPIRVLISYGESWFPWFMRRLAERPANVWFVVKNLL